MDNLTSKKCYKYIFPIGLFVYNIIDLFTTAFFVSLYGTEIEQNPIARWSMNHIGGFPTGCIKLLTTGLCCLLIFKFWDELTEMKSKRFLILFIYFAYLILASYYVGGLIYFFFVL